MSEPVRVCLVAPLPPPLGGIARGTSMLTDRAQGDPRTDVTVVDIAMRWRSIHETATTRRVTAGVRQLLVGAVGLSRVLLTRRQHLVHVKSSGGLGTVRDLVLLTLTKAARLPFVYHLHFGRVPRIAARQSLEWRLMAVVMSRATLVVVLDAATERAVRAKLPTTAVQRMPNGVDLDELPDVPAEAEPNRPKTVLFLGWVLATKGVEDLLLAWRDVARDGWELVVAGPGDESYVRSLRSRFAPPADVRFVGELSHEEAVSMMARCDIFVLPSHTEGFPNVVVEAMAMGRAVLATDVGAVGEMLADGRGVVVAPGRPADLADALAGLMADGARRSALGDRARVHAHREYAMPQVFERYVAMWARTSGLDLDAMVGGQPGRTPVS